MVTLHEAVRDAQANRSRRIYPTNKDKKRSVGGLLFPQFEPKFPIQFSNNTVFTIGSCFARNIERILLPRGVNLPTTDFIVPDEELAFRENGVLNEYNPGTMHQRIMYALGGKDYPTETIVPKGELFIDLLLHGSNPVTYDRALDRRREIAAVYGRLRSSDLVIVTLGLIECWYDNETQFYLNVLPPLTAAAKNRRRFELRRLDVSECIRLLEEAFGALIAAGPKILLTVSPVPLMGTFTPRDSVVANEYSKSVLRVAAEHLAAHPAIDYFPSFEIVRSGGLKSYVWDHIHVRPEIVERVTGYMLDSYAPVTASTSSELGSAMPPSISSDCPVM
jgi:hypothetical protein